MLTWLRDNAKIFLIATIVIFVALIFLRWGMGEGDNRPRNPYERPIATVDGKDILPEEYQQALQSWSQQYRSMLEQNGNPDPESMLLLMSSQISEEAFKGLIDQKLQGIYLQNHNWQDFTVGQAEELLIAQIGMQELGEMTAREYLDMIKSEQPGVYQQYLYQTYMNGNAMRFPLASGMVSMASMQEIDYLILDNSGQITARYIIVDTIPSMPDEEYLREFYENKPECFNRASGSLLRYITIQVLPEYADLEFAINRIDSLAYSTAGSRIAATRSQITAVFGDSITIEIGERTEPFLGMYTANSSISSYHVLLLDSLHESIDTITLDSASIQDDTLFLQSWEVPVWPQYSTVRRILWDLESGMEDMLAESVPEIPDSMIIVDFGEMLVEEDTPLSVIISEELVTFASDTLWNDPLGPVFYNPSYRGGYPAFTIVRRLDYFPADTSGYEDALESGLLQEAAMYTLRRETAMTKALEIVNDIHSSGINLATYASVESLQVFTAPAFTAAQIKINARTDPEAAGGLLYSEEFAEAALIAPEFEVIGPFRIGTSCVIAEILSRQVPAENQANVQTMMYISAQYGHEQLGASSIIRNLRATSDIRDLREEWSHYLETVEDSLRIEQGQLEE
ncbi:MAG: SurA N-terminal domain-containing protein [Candidatus Aegiribacteria sp.]|nr:SurA N-terminal domain-containing protein [Candidatus Aegiribacteria sp.]